MIIPHNSLYKLLVGYTLSTLNPVKVDLQLYLGTTKIFEPNKPVADLFFCNEECREGFQLGTNLNYNLKAGSYKVEITSLSAGALKLVRTICTEREI